MPYKPAANMDGHPVDRKPYNWHFSSQPGPALTNNVAGSSVWSDLAKYPAGCIPAGSIVQWDQIATDPQEIEVADGTVHPRGVAIYTRMAADARHQTYTIVGVVEMIAGTGGVTADDLIAPDTVAGYLGCAKTGADDDGFSFGRALTTATVGNRFWAFVDFSK